MKFCAISLPDRLIVVSPVPCSRLTTFQLLVDKAIASWENLKCDTELLVETHCQVLQQIANLLPRIDIPASQKLTGWDIKQMSIQQVQDFFFYKIDKQGEVTLSDLVILHQSTMEQQPETQLEPVEGEDIGNWMPPIPSCGDSEIDLVGQLLSAFGVEGVELRDRFDQNSLNLLIQSYNNNQQDPEVRRKEYMAKVYNEYKEGNSEIIKNALGLDTFDPRQLTNDK